MLLAIIELELDQRLDRFERLEIGEIELALGLAHGAISALQHGQIEVVLGAEIVIEHALVGGRLLGDDVDARTGKPLGGELDLRRGEQRLPRPLGVAHRLEARFAFADGAALFGFGVTATVITRLLSKIGSSAPTGSDALLAAMIAASPIGFGPEDAGVHLVQRRRHRRGETASARKYRVRDRCPARFRSAPVAPPRCGGTPPAR